MKIFRWIWNNILFVFTIFLLAFIPLYPKLPLVDIKNTWVYVRIEDFAIVFVLFIWVLLLLSKKITLKTPLTIPILLFWVFGGLSTIHGVLLIFPFISNVFSNVALLSFLRRIEYLSLFFIAFAGIKSKKSLVYIIAALVIILLTVVFYGVGQRYLGFPAFLTMNEEFAKGVPIQLSRLSRIPSTFAGHYDLAAYLVLMVPIIASVAFGIRNWFFKIVLFITAALGFGLLFMTVSRVSVFVLVLSIVFLLILQRKKWIIVSLLILTILFLAFSPSLLKRFGNTVTDIDVLVDGKTGAAIRQVKEVPNTYFENKIISIETATPQDQPATSSSTLPFVLIPPKAVLVIEPNVPNGETLPQGTEYINLQLSPIKKKVDEYFSEKITPSGTASARVVYGDFLIKRAKALDLSFTTRSQGEWPRTIEAFERNIFFGSGFGSVSLAVDNNYLRILGESGLLGFVSFLSIFLFAGIYIKKILPKVDAPIVRSFVLGFIAGTFGLLLNAVLIDVFEASKIAFTYWLLMGVTLGVLHLYKKIDFNIFKEYKNALTSPIAVIVYLFTLTFAFFSSMISNYFVGDDFTWLRWVSDHQTLKTFIGYFTESNGFFYRPGTKAYFSLMYSIFWLNQTMYHLVSVSLHFAAAVLVFFISRRILKNYSLSVLSAVVFLLLSAHHEDIFWISSTGFLFNAVFALSSLLFFIHWKEKKRGVYFVSSLVCIIFSLLFHEIGVIAPFLIILYDVVFGEKDFSKKTKKMYLILLSPLLPYLLLRLIAQSHWFSGDYSYNILKLPYNFIGNTFGYLLLNLFGPSSLPLYETFRNLSRSHALLLFPVFVLIVIGGVILYKKIKKKIPTEEWKIVTFAFLFFIIALLPFLGLGNISSRYSYLSSVGFVMLFVFFFKKIFNNLLSISDRYTATLFIVIFVIIFSCLQLFQLQRLSIEWKTAGEKSKKFLVSLQQDYTDYWTKDAMKFYFASVPIRFGEAWVFPVGLNDAVWFVFHNNRITVNQVPVLSDALNLIEDPLYDKAFEFDGTGAVIEKKKVKTTNASSGK